MPDLEQIFRYRPANTQAQGDVSDIVLDKMRPHLNLIQSQGMISYATGGDKMVFGTTGGGNKIELRINVESKYYEIADRVMKK